jgi:cell division protein FtsB
MIGLALIVASVLLYKAYKQHLKHNSELKQLREENARLKAQLEALRKEYQQVLAQGQWSVSGGGEKITDAQKLAQLAEAIRRKEPLM